MCTHTHHSFSLFLSFAVFGGGVDEITLERDTSFCPIFKCDCVCVCFNVSVCVLVFVCVCLCVFILYPMLYENESLLQGLLAVLFVVLNGLPVKLSDIIHHLHHTHTHTHTS